MKEKKCVFCNSRFSDITFVKEEIEEAIFGNKLASASLFFCKKCNLLQRRHAQEKKLLYDETKLEKYELEEIEEIIERHQKEEQSKIKITGWLFPEDTKILIFDTPTQEKEKWN